MLDTIPTLSDTELETVLNNPQPVLLLFTRGDDLRNEFSIALKKAVTEHDNIVFAQINPDDNPKSAERFNIGSKPVLIAYYGGAELARRVRPWGTDVPLAIELLKNALPQEQPDTPLPEPSEEEKRVDNQPVTVTDETFQQKVIEYELPVVIDFWAPWCGPCKMVAPILDKLAQEYAGKIRIAKVNVDENPQLAAAFQVMSIPTIMMIKERTIVFSQPGALPESALRELFDRLIELEIPRQEPEPEAVH